ncbi:hypothetical protein [Actinoplanes sp. NPDC049802]|uniref:hypothetical protein n=1 Tax=Actinoplanes sp. NPDC049802 TaxID=3154742 RepID=UPI0033C9C047
MDAIVERICAVETFLPGDQVRQIVARTVRGPVIRRRVAQELRGNPQVLTSGESPSVLAVGRLLAALRKAGARGVSAPRCCGCGKELRTLCSRRGGFWCCRSCHRPPEVCVGCGRTRVVNKRDRQGQPLCQKCPDDGCDEAQLVDLVVELEPAMTVEVVAGILQQVAVRAVLRRRMTRDVLERPGLLTGDGAEAPEPRLLRFIERLTAAGATTVALPRCPRCGEQRKVDLKIDGRRVCQPCFKQAKAQPCSRCGIRRPRTWRDESGLLVCSNCMRRDPMVRERCTVCGNLRQASVRHEDGRPVCGSCRPRQHGTCSICGRHKEVEIGQVSGLPWCKTCVRLWKRCSRCRTVAPVRAGTLAQPLCARCLEPDPARWRSCHRCGTGWQLTTVACQRCQLALHLEELLTVDGARLRPELLVLQTALTSVERPDTALLWLGKRQVHAILARLRDRIGPLGHDVLDELPPSPTLAHIRSVLVAAGTLPHRDERSVALERLAREAVNARPDPAERRILHGYAHWRLLRRLRQRLRPDEAITHQQYLNVRRLIVAAVAFLDRLPQRQRTMATCTQGDVDAILLLPGIHAKNASAFIRWAVAQRHASGIVVPTFAWTGPNGPFDENQRWATARRLLHDDSVSDADRVAGLIILLYAQQMTAVIRLQASQVSDEDGRILLRLGTSPIQLAPPLDQIMRDLLAGRRGRSVLGAPGESPWLFPGNRPGQHIGESGMRKRLTKIGVQPRAGRNAALFALATELPAAVLSRKLGLSIDVSAYWQRLSAGDWMGYAADISDRPSPTTTRS